MKAGSEIITLTVLAMQANDRAAQVSGGFFDLVTRMGSFALTILVILLVFSLLSWAIILRKYLTFRDMQSQNRAFVAFFRKSSRLSEVNAACEHYRRTPLSGLFSAGYQELNVQLQSHGEGMGGAKGNPGRTTLTDRNLTAIQRALQRASAAELSVLERSMSWLASTASVTPFIGLLGTVVGIINAFQGLGLERTASIQAVAPGIAEALVATAAGLFAAIPALLAYNQFVHRIKEAGAEMDDFAAEFMNLIERSFS